MLCLADIIFCIYLYQRWIYRVDPKRVNEFGTSAEMLDQQQVADGQNGAIPALESLANGDEPDAGSNSETIGDAMEPPSEPEKSQTEKKED